MILLQKSVIQEKIGTFLSLSEMYEKEEKKKLTLFEILVQRFTKTW